MHNEPQAKKPEPALIPGDKEKVADLQSQIEAAEVKVARKKAELAEPKAQVPVQRVKPLPDPEEQQRLLSLRDQMLARAATPGMYGLIAARVVTSTSSGVHQVAKALGYADPAKSDDFEEMKDLETLKAGWANWLEKVDDVSKLMDRAKLPPQQRAVYPLSEEYRLPNGEKLSDREIARRLGLHPKTVYNHRTAAENAIELTLAGMSSKELRELGGVSEWRNRLRIR